MRIETVVLERLDPLLEQARHLLDPATVAALTEQGRTLTPDAILAEISGRS